MSVFGNDALSESPSSNVLIVESASSESTLLESPLSERSCSLFVVWIINREPKNLFAIGRGNNSGKKTENFQVQITSIVYQKQSVLIQFIFYNE